MIDAKSIVGIKKVDTVVEEVAVEPESVPEPEPEVVYTEEHQPYLSDPP